jgi:hypothetical protein
MTKFSCDRGILTYKAEKISLFGLLEKDSLPIPEID